MESKAFENEFIKNIELLSQEQRAKALVFVKSLLTKPKAHREQGLLKFAGSIDHNTANEMRKAIQEGCKNIDENEWR